MPQLPFITRFSLLFVALTATLTDHIIVAEAKPAASRSSSALSYSVPTSVGVVEIDSLPNVRRARKARRHHSSRLGLYGQPSVASESYTDPDKTIVYAEETPELAARANKQIQKSASRIADNAAANSLKAPEMLRLSTRRAQSAVEGGERRAGPPISYDDVEQNNDDFPNQRRAYDYEMPHRRRRPVVLPRRRAAVQNSAKAYKRSHNRGHDTLTKATGDLDTYGQRLEYGYAELEGYGLKDFSASNKNNGVGEDERLSSRIAETQLGAGSNLGDSSNGEESTDDGSGRYARDFANGVKGLNFDPKFF